MKRGISKGLAARAQALFDEKKPHLVLALVKPVIERLKGVVTLEQVQTVAVEGVKKPSSGSQREVDNVVPAYLWPVGEPLPEGARLTGWLAELLDEGLECQLEPCGPTLDLVASACFEEKAGRVDMPEGLEEPRVSEAIGEAVGRLESWVVATADELAIDSDGCLIHGSEVNAKMLAAEFARILRALRAERAAETGRTDDFAPAVADELIALGIETPSEADLFVLTSVPQIFEAKLRKQ